MHQTQYPSRRPCVIPAHCFNLIRLARRRSGSNLEVPLPGLRDNILLVREDSWRCFNRKLNRLLISWESFQSPPVTRLNAPVTCVQTLHHAYGRTVLHHVYDSLCERLQWEQDQWRNGEAGASVVLPWRQAG